LPATAPTPTQAVAAEEPPVLLPLDAPDDGKYTSCPFCAERIMAGARKCKHCGETLDPTMRAAQEARRAAERPRDRYEPRPEPRSNSLGIASLVLGLVAFVVSVIPCLGVVSLPFAGLGLLLGVAGVVVSLGREGRGIGFAVAGTAVSGGALLVGLFWMNVLEGYRQRIAEKTGLSKKADDPAPDQEGGKGQRDPDPVDRPPDQEGRPVAVDAPALLDAYAGARPPARYAGKILDVRGAVRGVGVDQQDNHSVSLVAHGGKIDWEGPAVICRVRREDAEKLRRLQGNELVTLRGRCQGKTRDGVLLSDAQVVEIRDPENP
jgi:hypothetical protein